MSILIFTSMLQSVVVYTNQYFSFLFCCAAKFEVMMVASPFISTFICFFQL